MPVPTFEIFLGYFEKEVLWLEAVRGLRSASVRMKQRAEEFPGPYFVFCTKTHSVRASIDTSECEVEQGAKGSPPS
jgi:hypothetical protein